jgi:hypothetical protein
LINDDQIMEKTREDDESTRAILGAKCGTDLSFATTTKIESAQLLPLTWRNDKLACRDPYLEFLCDDGLSSNRY